MTRPLALTLGEPAGIGPDITLQAFARRAELNLPAFYLIGDTAFLQERSALLGLDVPIEDATPESAIDVFARALPVVSSGVKTHTKPGKPDATSAAFSPLLCPASAS